jgi:starch-binding outer membrane protein, SusD/RagB family
MRIIKIVCAGLILMMAASCEGLLDNQPKSEINSDNFYQTEADALAAVFACYEYLSGGAFNDNFGGLYYNNYWVIQALASDEGQNNDASIDKQRLSTFTYDPANSLVYQVWRDAYHSIAATNIAVENIPNIEMDATLRTSLEAEARFIRGLVYFELVRMFGDVPLILKTIKSVEEANRVVRTPESEVYQQIITDLQFAAEFMPASHPAEYAGRATKYSASGILGKVYLTLGEWDKCIAELEKVMAVEGTKFDLWKDYGEVFKIANNNGKEVVFSINFSSTDLFWEAGQFNVRLLPTEINLNSQEWEVPTEDLYASFPTNDRRKEVTFITSFVKDGTLLEFPPCIQKYWDRGREANASSTFNDLPLLRYADILLMYSEAVNEKSGPSAQAYAPINKVRARARYHADDDQTYAVLPDLVGLSKEQLRDSILMERKREFAFEGHRWFDLVRMNKLIEKVQEAKPTSNVQGYHKHFPVPQREINTSSIEVPQNDGYVN